MNNNFCGNCETCILNINASAWPGHRLPCGQFMCWEDPSLLGEDDLDNEDSYEDGEVDFYAN